MTTPPHDPESDAAVYLGGGLRPAQRSEFEAHALGCDACWAEVREARTGRALAESLREAAPQALRERVRAIAAISPEPTGLADAPFAPRTRRPLLGARAARLVVPAAAVAALGTAAALLIPGSSPGGVSPLVAAATVYQEGPRDAPRAEVGPPVPNIGDMTWQGSAAASLGGQVAIVHRYADAAGHRVALMSSTVEFPRAAGAVPVDAMGKNWIAAVGGAQILCVDHGGLSWLVITDSRDEALTAGREAGLV